MFRLLQSAQDVLTGPQAQFPVGTSPVPFAAGRYCYLTPGATAVRSNQLPEPLQVRFGQFEADRVEVLDDLIVARPTVSLVHAPSVLIEPRPFQLLQSVLLLQQVTQT